MNKLSLLWKSFPQEAFFMIKSHWRQLLCGSTAGMINGLFGAGGGMVLIPLLSSLVRSKEETLFPSSVCIMLPICVVSLCMMRINSGALPWQTAWPYLIGSAIGGILAGFFAKKIPPLYLHKGLGILIIWGGVRYLC